MGDKDAADSVPSGGSQKVIKREGNTLWVRVERRAPSGASPGPAAEEFLKPNGFIQSDDKLIVDKAVEIAGGIKDPWEKCRKLERWVYEKMAHGDFSVAFATASDTIRSLKGDCTEHGVLLAALCRAAGVPARVAMGLVYVDSLQSFGYHMWAEVNLGGEWYGIDGTIGEGSVGGEHIKITDGSLKGASAMSTMLPVFQVMGKMKIEVEKIE
jgi:transglutaminase-like putative cysteine protease